MKTYIRSIQLTSDIPEENYLSGLKIVKYLGKSKEISFPKPVTIFVGENGTGKSTLLEAIAVSAGYNAEGGSKNFNFSTKNTTSNLADHLALSRIGYEKDGFFLRAESFYNVASQVEDLHLNLAQYGGKSLHEQSHGESFLALVQNRFRGNGLYILDEPEAALSPSRQLTLLLEIKRLADQNSQFIISTHSPLLLSFPGAAVYQIDESGIHSVRYDETEHFLLMKRFLNDPQHILNKLFE